MGSLKKSLPFILAGCLWPLVTFAIPSSVDRVTDHIQPLINTDYIKAQYYVATSTTATSTFANGINLTGGCFSVLGVCISSGGSGTVTQINTTFPIEGGPITTTGSITFGGLTTSTPAVVGNIPYFSGVNTFANVATSTLTATSPLTGSFTHIGTTGSLGCQTASGSQAGCLASADWTLFNNKVSSTSLSATYPLTYNSTTGVFTFTGLATSSPFSANQFVYTNAAGNLVTAASSSLSLPNAALQNSTIGLSSSDSSLTVSGSPASLGGSLGAVLNVGHANVWTALQTFANASSTLFSAGYASTTNLVVSGQSGCASFTAGVLTGTGVACGSGSGSAYPFPLTGNATSTLTQFNGGLTAFSSSTIGGATAGSGLTISGTGSTTKLYVGTQTGKFLSSGNVVAIVDDGGTLATIQHSSYNSIAPTIAPLYEFIRGRGTATVPVALLANDQAGGILAQGYDGSTYDNLARIRFFAGATTSPGVSSGYIDFRTTNVAGTETTAVTIDNQQFVGIGTTTPAMRLSVEGNSTLGNNATAGYFIATTTTASQLPYASTTALSSSILTPGNCVQASTGGLLTTVGSACGSGSGSSFGYPFTTGTYAGITVNSTSTPIRFTGSSPFSILASSTFANTASTTNFEGTLYADNFPGSDIGAKVNAAYAALPSYGGVIHIPSGQYSFSTAMSFQTNSKPVLLECDGGNGTKLTYTGSATSTIFNTGNDSPYPGVAGMRGCQLYGAGGSTSVGIQLGGSNGAAGYTIDGNHIVDFGYGIRTEANTYAVRITSNILEYNNRAIHIERANNSGENMIFADNIIADCDTVTKCFYSEVNGMATADFVDNSFDDAQLYLEDGNISVNMTGGHFENPAQMTVGQYTYIVTSPGSFTKMSITGTGFFNGATTTGKSPYQYIYNGGYMSLHGVSVQSFNDVSSPAFVQNYGSDGEWLDVFGIKEVGTAIDAVATTTTSMGLLAQRGSTGVGTTSPGSLFSIGGSGTGWNFFDNATSTSAAKGINLINGGCFAIAGVCVGGGGSSLAFGYPFTIGTNWSTTTSATTTALQAPAFFASSTLASQFPYASSTAFTVSGALYDSALTPTRVPYISTGGQFIDSTNLTFDGSALASEGGIFLGNGDVGTGVKLVSAGAPGSVTATFPMTTGTVCLTTTSGCATFGYLFPNNSTTTLLNLFGGASTTAFSANMFAVGGTGTTSIANDGTLKIQTLSGLLKATSGTVSTASAGTDYVAGGTGANTQVTYFTGSGAIAGDAGMTYDATNDRLTVVSATTTNLSASYASSTSAYFGTLNLPNITGTQCLHSISGVVSGTGSDCGSGSATTPGGSSLQIQYNMAGSFGGSAALSIATSTGTATLTVGDSSLFPDGTLKIAHQGSVANGYFTITGTPGGGQANSTLTLPSVSGTFALGTGSSGQAAYWTSNNVLTSVATSSITNGTGISFTGTPGALIGGTNLTINNTGVTSAVAGTGIAVSGATGAVTITNLIGYPFTPTTNFAATAQATTGIPWFQNGLQASSTSRVASTTFAITGNVGIGSSTPFWPLSVATVHALGGVGGPVAYFGDAVPANSNPVTYSYKSGGSSGASAVLGFNSFIDAGGTSRVINTISNGWQWKTDNRDFGGSDSSSMSFHSISRDTTDNTYLTILGAGDTLAGAVLTAARVGVGSSTPWGQLSVDTGSLASNIPEFTVGSSTRQDFVILQSGKVGVATSSPFKTLSVKGTVAIDGLTTSTAGQAVCILVATKEIVQAGNTTCNTSSIKTKHDVDSLTMQEALNEVMALNPIAFTYNESGDRRVGFIAEDVSLVDPRLVDLAKEDLTFPNATGVIKKGDPVAVEYGNITALLVKVAQYQQQQIDNLRGVGRTLEDNLKTVAIGFFLLYVVYNEISKCRKRK